MIAPSREQTRLASRGTTEVAQNFATLKTAQIGRCGELLVQWKLLLRGIESAPMTTDSGIDLVAYAPPSSGAVTIQVKTNLQPKPRGGKGKKATPINKERFVNKMFLRGDSVIVVLKNPR